MAPRNNQDTELNKIKIPAYISEPITNNAEVVETYEEMIEDMVRKIDSYNNRDNEHKVGSKLRGKSITKQIYHIDFDRYYDGDVPIILLRISEKKKGFTDLTIEPAVRENSSIITQDDILATQYNCAVLYPNIDNRGGEISNNWITFVYVDPGKTDRDIISTIKTTLQRVLGLKIKNVKSNAANELIQKEGLISKLKVQYVIVYNNDNESLDIRGEQISSTIKEVKKFEYQDIPSEDVERFVNRQNECQYTERKISVSLADNQELKYIHKINAEQVITDAIEQIYNYETDMLRTDFPRMYNSDFILEKVRGAARQFFSNE
jgi:hypothetical protein